ncbi:hypothetical protein [Micromonospora psammae]|uniref:hypothetical protein n=1 Tax=Micromonospora sp. CPCC 205556 TaxID=3122398 RepID=UPI002FF2A53C
MLILSEDVYCAVGRVVVGTAYLDDMLAGVVVRLLDSRRGLFVVAGQPYSYLSQAARVLGVEVLEPELRSELFELLNEAQGLHEKRDLVVHGIWLPHADEVHKLFEDETSISRHMTFRRRRWKSGMRGEVVSLESITELAADIEDLAKRLGYFLANRLPRQSARS